MSDRPPPSFDPPPLVDPRFRESLERLIDHLQVAAPLLSRLTVVAKQQSIDSRQALDAIENAVAILRTFRRPEKGGA